MIEEKDKEIQELLDYNVGLNKICAKELIIGIKRKRKIEEDRIRKKQSFNTYRNYSWMYEQLTIQEKSFKEVAETCRVVRGTIYFWAKKLEIPFMSVSKRMKMVMNYPDSKAKLIKKMKKVMNRPDVKAKCRRAAKISQNLPKVRAKMLATKEKNGTTTKEVWKTAKFREAYRKGIKAKPNRLEQFFNGLTPKCVRFVGDFKFWVTTKKGSRNPDFIIENQKKVIELFGDFWHKDENPKDKIEEYAEAGWECIVFWESEVYNETDRVLRETLEFIDK